MTEVITLYVQQFLHPFRTQKLLGSQRERRERLTLIEGGDEPERVEFLNFAEVTLVSWIPKIIHSFYGIFIFYIGTEIGSRYLEESGLSSYAGETLGAPKPASFIMFQILSIVFFPLFLWVYARFWVAIVKFFAKLFDKDDDEQEVEEASEQVVFGSLCSHMFLVIPIFGKFLNFTVAIFYMFAGLRNNMKFSRIQSFLVLIAPVLLLATIAIMGLMLGVTFQTML